MVEWWEKEEHFYDVYRSGRHATDLWKYIPERFVEAIDDTAIDSDGYWIYLRDGYRAYDLDVDGGIIHEYSIADLKEAIKTIRRVMI